MPMSVSYTHLVPEEPEPQEPDGGENAGMTEPGKTGETDVYKRQVPKTPLPAMSCTSRWATISSRNILTKKQISLSLIHIFSEKL